MTTNSLKQLLYSVPAMDQAFAFWCEYSLYMSCSFFFKRTWFNKYSGL